MRRYLNSLLERGKQLENAALIPVFLCDARLLLDWTWKSFEALTRQMFMRVIDFS